MSSVKLSLFSLTVGNNFDRFFFLGGGYPGGVDAYDCVMGL